MPFFQNATKTDIKKYMILRCNSKIDEKICLKFYPCKNKGKDITFEEWHNEKPLTIFLMITENYY